MSNNRGRINKLLERLCLRQNGSLRQQVLISFGLAASITIASAVVLSIVVLRAAGYIVKDRSKQVMHAQITGNLVQTTASMAETLERSLQHHEGTVELVAEITLDRMAGYPESGWETDKFVPFRDMESNTNRYPLNSPPVPLEWQITPDATRETIELLAPGRGRWFDRVKDFVSFTSGSYFMQGQCDPGIRLPVWITYAPNCTAAHNDVNAGGVIQPTPMNKFLYERSGDLALLMRPLYERSPEVSLLGVYFHNGGAGATIHFPGLFVNGLAEPFESAGCEWMKEKNPFTGLPYGTDEEMARCHPKGYPVPPREYNPNEREWFQAIVLNHGKLTWYGPYGWYGADSVVLTVGKAIYDRRTQHFIGVVALDISLSDLGYKLAQAKLFDNSEVGVLTAENGTVVTDSRQDDAIRADQSFAFDWIEAGLLSQSAFQEMKREITNIFNLSEWTQELYTAALESLSFSSPYGVAVVYPLPTPPPVYDEAYFPEYFVVQVVTEEEYQAIRNFGDSVDDDVLAASFFILGAGTFGMLLILSILICVASRLTQPLQWMESVSWDIVNHTNEGTGLNFDEKESRVTNTSCSPESEISQLVEEFQKMIQGFSGVGASVVSEPDTNELRNSLKWQSDFRDLYTRASTKKSSIRRHMSEQTPTTAPDDVSYLSSVAQDDFVVAEPTSVYIGGQPKDPTPTLNRGNPKILEVDEFVDPFAEESNSEVDLLASNEHLVGSAAQESRDSVEIEEACHDTDKKNQDPSPNSGEVPTSNVFVQEFSPKRIDEKLCVQAPSVDMQRPLLTQKTSISGVQVFPAPPKQHFGNNTTDFETLQSIHVEGRHEVYRSRLFRWIVLLIVFPLILTSLFICIIVTSTIRDRVPSWVDTLGDELLDVEIAALFSITRSKADELETILTGPMRDLYLLYRISGWLHFHGARQSESFTEILSPTEECKSYPLNMCPVTGTEEYPCPCIWDQRPLAGSCVAYNASFSRSLQRRWFSLSKLDQDPITGERTHSWSFPEHAHSAATTSWWSLPDEIPGSWLRQNVSGFSTSHDRLRVSSTLAVVEFPIFNYVRSLDFSDPRTGTFIGYEKDGLFAGFSGCRHSAQQYSHFVSSDSNGAYLISPELCPKGRYGYDPRCRSWYHDAKLKYESSSDTLHITAPYYFADGNTFGLTAVSPIENPKTATFFGAMEIDFVPSGLRDALATVPEPLSFIVTPQEDIFGGDTVVGIDKTRRLETSAIIDELLPFDKIGSALRNNFESTLLSQIRAGEASVSRFGRTPKEGKEEEEIVLGFAPVMATMLSAIDPSDLSQGVTSKQLHIYTVGIASPKLDTQEPFERIEDDVNDDLDRLTIVHASMVLVFSLVFVVVVAKIAFLVTEPMIILLHVVQRINSKDKNKALPLLHGGSREVNQVYNCFSKLYKVIRISNRAFFAGDLYKAFEILNDALSLFRKIQDQKAIGVACNNLGNTIFAMILERGKETESSLNYGWGTRAFQCFDEAVEISQTGFAAAESMHEKAKFALELADRLFNRGLYMLFMDGESDAPPDAKARGIEDISRVRDLDYDVRDFLLENNMLLGQSREIFSCMLRRLHGLCDHFDVEELREVWDLRELIHEADQLLFAAWYHSGAPIFDEVTRVGRLQQLEEAAMRAESLLGNHNEAARMAMRMFAEDEYIIESAFAVGGRAVLRFGEGSMGKRWAPKSLQSMKSDLRKMGRISRSPSLDLGKCVVFAIELNERWEGTPILELLRSKCLNLFERHCIDDDFVGIVAYTVEGNYTQGLRQKGENCAEQRRLVELAMTSTSEQVCPALPYAMQVVLDSDTSAEMDTYVLLVTDGYSWDTEAYRLIKEEINQLNHDREGKIHIIIIGLDVEDEGVVDECADMCSVSKGSSYVGLNLENVDSSFSSIASLFSERRLLHAFRNSMAMQKFS